MFIMNFEKSARFEEKRGILAQKACSTQTAKLGKQHSFLTNMLVSLYSLFMVVKSQDFTPINFLGVTTNCCSSASANTGLAYDPKSITYIRSLDAIDMVGIMHAKDSDSSKCGIHVVAFDGSNSASKNCENDLDGWRPFLVLKEAGSGSTSDMQIFVTQSGSKRVAYLYSFQAVSSLWSISKLGKYSVSIGSGSDFMDTATDIPNTAYMLFIENNSNNKYIGKIDMVSGSLEVYSAGLYKVIVEMNPRGLMPMDTAGTKAFAFEVAGSSIYIFDTTSLSLLKDYWKEISFQNLVAKSNNLNSSEVYRAGNLNSPNSFRFEAFDISSGTFAYKYLILQESSTRSIANILNFGSFNYVGLAVESSSSQLTRFSLYDKTDYYLIDKYSTSAADKSYTGANLMLTAVGREITGSKAGIILASSNANNFQSYDIEFGCASYNIVNGVNKLVPYYPMYLVSESPLICDNMWLIRGSFGANVDTYYKEACQVANCWDCRTKSSDCYACMPGYVWSLNYDGPNPCVLPAALPDGFGKKDISYTDRIPTTTVSVSQACSKARCIDCRDNYTVCKGCNVSAGYFLNETTGTCVNTFADTFGPNLDTGKADSCADPNCKTCNTDIKICTSCLNSPSTYYLYKGSTVDSKCLQTSQFPAGYAVSGTNAVPCDVTKNCATCKVTDYQKCTSCTVGSLYFYYATDNTCITVDYIPATYGADTTTNVVKQCNQYPDCKLCQKSYTECTSCDYTTRNMYLELSTSQCILNTALGVGRGPNTTNGTVTDCQDPNCDNCKTDYKVCTVCMTANKYYLDTSTGLCVKDVDITAGKGANLVTKKVDTCTSAGCIDCRTDITICSVCNTTLFYYLDTVTKKCVLTSNIPNTFGANTVTGNIDMCTLPHCLQCQQDYSQCISCDYSTGWYYDANLQVCVEVKDISSYVGACSKAGGSCVQGTVSQCTQTGCLLCQADNTACTACDKNSGYYMKDPAVNASMATCTLYSDLPGGIGADLVSGKVKKCSDPGCLKCQDNYQQCGLCNNATTPPYYLNPLNEQCTLEKDITDGFGVNKATNMIESCADIHCVSCVKNFSVCVKCDTNTLYYLDSATASCVNFADIPNGFGPNLDPFPSPNPKFGVIEACQKDKCLFCQNDYSVCTGCDMSKDYFLSRDNPADCIYVTTIPNGFGGNRENGRVEFCEQSQCLLCQYDTTICTKCDLKKDYYIEANTCFSHVLAPNRFGIDRKTGELADCIVAHCLVCQKDNSVCTDCDYMDGYYLEGNVCQKADTGLLLSLNPRKPTNVDLSLILTTAITLPVNQTLFYQQMVQVLKLTLQFSSVESGRVVQLSASTMMTPLDQGVQIDIVLTDFPPEKLYSVIVRTQKAMNVTVGEEMFRVGGTNGTFPMVLKASLQEVAGAKAQGAAVGAMMGNNMAVTTIIMTAVALDPTGVLMKFNQILKVINKLYFININYGTRLTVFLAQIGGTPDKKTTPKEVYHSKATRGKFSRAHLPLELFEENLPKCLVYGLSSFIQLINYLVLSNRNRCSLIFLYFVYYSLKVHLIIFNLVFIDFIWFGSRCLLHSRGLSAVEYSVTLAMLTFLSIDLVLVFNNVTMNRYWRYRMREYNIFKYYRDIEEIKMEDEERLRATWKRKHKNSKQPLPEDLQPPKITKKDFSGKPIDYDRTVECIFSNPHLFQVMSNTLRPTREAYLNELPRSLFMVFLVRGILYQALIISGSYICGATICMLMVVEIAKIGHSVYCYVKYKYLKNIICLLMEVMQSFFLFLFLAIAAIIHPKGFDEIIMDFYQDAGIWIVIASCVAEYLLLITYIAVAAYEFFKNRTLNKRANSHRNTSFIKYSTPAVYQSISSEGKINDKNNLPSPMVKTTPQNTISPKNWIIDRKFNKAILGEVKGGIKIPLSLQIRQAIDSKKNKNLPAYNQVASPMISESSLNFGEQKVTPFTQLDHNEDMTNASYKYSKKGLISTSSVKNLQSRNNAAANLPGQTISTTPLMPSGGENGGKVLSRFQGKNNPGTMSLASKIYGFRNKNQF
jgi:hypothetical protein